MYSFSYLFEGSSELRYVNGPTERISGEELCELIVKDIFGSSLPPCKLTTDTESVAWWETATIKRVYGNKFEEKVKPKAKKKVRVRRWRSRSPRKRWHSPVNRYMPVYTHPSY